VPTQFIYQDKNHTAEELLALHDVPPWVADIQNTIRYWLSDESVLYVQTSGSTGESKIIELSKKMINSSAKATIDFFGLSQKNTAALVLPAAFIGGKMMIFRALMAELQLVLYEPKAKFHPTNSFFDFVAMTPMQAAQSIDKLKNIRKLLLGGSSVSPSLEMAIIEAKLQAWHSYGMTETASHVALRKMGQPHFLALPGITFTVDTHNALTIHAKNLGIDWLQTNDIVDLKSPTSFIWLGRKDNVVNSGGVKLFPEKIEEKLAIHIKNNLMVAAKYDELLGQKLILVIESNDAFEIDFHFLPKLERPKEVIFLKRFNYTKNGKLDRANTLKLISI